MAVVEYTVSTNVGLAMAFSLSEALAFLCVRQVQFVSNHCSHEPVIARSHSWSTMSRRSTEVPPFSFRDLPYAPKASESSTISRAWIQQRPREVLIASKGLRLAIERGSELFGGEIAGDCCIPLYWRREKSSVRQHKWLSCWSEVIETLGA